MKLLKHFKFLYLTMVFTGCCCEGDEPSECADNVRKDLFIQISSQDINSYKGGTCVLSDFQIDPCAPASDYGSNRSDTKWYGNASFETPACCDPEPSGSFKKWIASNLETNCNMKMRYVEGVGNAVTVVMETPEMACHPNGSNDMHVIWQYNETIPKSFSGTFYMDCKMIFGGVYQ